MMTLKRSFWVWLHRWAGLVMASFLIIVGITGSLLAFYPELEQLINPQFYPKQTLAHKLDVATLAELTEQRIASHGQVDVIALEDNQGATLAGVSARLDETGQPGELGFDQIILDPYTGEELVRRQFGAISEGMTNFMSFIYQLHYALALGSFGMWVLGICALIWTLDCFVGFYLTLPQRRRQSTSTASVHSSWWQRWQPAWKIRWQSSRYKLNFDLHRTSGLWLWLVLLTFAWSAVYMNLWDTVYTWTTRTVMEYKAPWTELEKREIPLAAPKINWREAQSIAEKLMAEQADQHNFAVERVVALALNRMNGVYVYTVRSSKEIQDKQGSTSIYFDANSGELKLALLPSGQYSGNTVTTWLKALHMANVFGLPYRIFICVLGLVIVLLSVTGIIIWMKKRQARFSMSSRQQESSYLNSPTPRLP